MIFRQREAIQELPAELAASVRADAMRMAQRPEEFWTRQEVQIRARLHRRQPARGGRLWLAVAGTALLLVAVLLTEPTRQPLPVTPSRAEVDADQELLMAVENALERATPEALQPVTLIVESRSTSNQVDSVPDKEKRSEN
jgi:hypothetical protein